MKIKQIIISMFNKIIRRFYMYVVLPTNLSYTKPIERYETKDKMNFGSASRCKL